MNPGERYIEQMERNDRLARGWELAAAVGSAVSYLAILALGIWLVWGVVPLGCSVCP